MPREFIGLTTDPVSYKQEANSNKYMPSKGSSNVCQLGDNIYEEPDSILQNAGYPMNQQLRYAAEYIGLGI